MCGPQDCNDYCYFQKEGGVHHSVIFQVNENIWEGDDHHQQQIQGGEWLSQSCTSTPPTVRGAVTGRGWPPLVSQSSATYCLRSWHREGATTTCLKKLHIIITDRLRHREGAKLHVTITNCLLRLFINTTNCLRCWHTIHLTELRVYTTIWEADTGPPFVSPSCMSLTTVWGP